VSTDDGSSDRMAPRVFSYRRGQAAKKREWWDEPKAAVRRDPVKDVSFFEFNMPEHLPNSPMCPAHPLYKGKGRLVCVVSALLYKWLYGPFPCCTPRPRWD